MLLLLQLPLLLRRQLLHLLTQPRLLLPLLLQLLLLLLVLLLLLPLLLNLLPSLQSSRTSPRRKTNQNRLVNQLQKNPQYTTHLLLLAFIHLNVQSGPQNQLTLTLRTLVADMNLLNIIIPK